MQIVYKKSENEQKTAENTASSIDDISSQNKSLQCKADMVNKSVLCMKSPQSCAAAQRMRVQATLDDYENNYGPEIDRTETNEALHRMDANCRAARRTTPPFWYTDSYDECKLRFEQNRDSGVYEAIFITIPNPRENPYKKENMRNLNVKNISKKISGDDARRVFAIHELEHLRVISKNSNRTLISATPDCSEPYTRSYVKNNIVPIKEELVNRLRSKIPKKLDENLKEYINERLSYILRPYGNGPVNESARELTTVLIELEKFCDCARDRKLNALKSELHMYYELWKK